VKLALLGDIHGNHLALQVVLGAASSAGAECLLVTGDLVGYYYAPSEVLKMLRVWDRHVVRGNHEDMLHSVRSEPDLLLQVDSTLREWVCERCRGAARYATTR
jgi:Icc-related predicted phosphoesterase